MSNNTNITLTIPCTVQPTTDDSTPSLRELSSLQIYCPDKRQTQEPMWAMHSRCIKRCGAENSEGERISFGACHGPVIPVCHGKGQATTTHSAPEHCLLYSRESPLSSTSTDTETNGRHLVWRWSDGCLYEYQLEWFINLQN